MIQCVDPGLSICRNDLHRDLFFVLSIFIHSKEIIECSYAISNTQLMSRTFLDCCRLVGMK